MSSPQPGNLRPSLRPATSVYCGPFPPFSGGLGGGGCGLLGGLLDDLSSLKIPTIFPKKPFFFCGSSAVDPGGGTTPGGAAALSPPIPNMREKNPLPPFLDRKSDLARCRQ